MDNLEKKKLALVRVLQILEKYSDYDHPLKQADIVRILEQEYGITLERKAVGRNVALLKDAGFEIESRRAGSFLEGRTFTDAELRVLIDGVLSSKHIPAKYSKELIEKLCSLTSKYFRHHIKHVHSVSEWDKTENKALFYNIEIVDEAIERKKQIIFDYNKYGPDKKLHKTQTHRVSPYQLVLHNQRYYLMAKSEKWGNIIFFRLERITNMMISEERLTPVTTVEGYKNGINFKDLSTALPYMYTDRPEPVEFIAEDYVIDQVIDWFGRDIRIEKAGETQYKITVRVSPMAMEHWAMQYAPHVRVTSPPSLVEKVREDLKTALAMYGE